MPYLSYGATIWPDDSTIKIGMSGTQTGLLQRYLSQLGFFPKNIITGNFGPRTEKSVWYFQKAFGIRANGIVGPKTKKKLSEQILLLTLPVSATTTSKSTTDITVPPVVVSTVTMITDISKYNIDSNPNYDLKKLALEIHDLVNKEREKNLLSSISWDNDLEEMATAHSKAQAVDNIEITNPTLPCHYPIIHHEGFTVSGYSLQDRLSTWHIAYHTAGENIAMIPTPKDLLYLNPLGQEVQTCPKVPKFEVGDGTEENRTTEFRRILDLSKKAESSILPVKWINKRWRTSGEIAVLTVEGWMNSPGHRENILRKEYTVGGIGIASVNDYVIITQNFAGR